MALLTTAEIKHHLGIADEETGWDVLLAGYAATAERMVELKTGRSIGAAPTGSLAPAFTAADLEVVKHAVRLMVGDWFAHRESTSVGNVSGELPLGIKFLLAPLEAFLDR